MEQGYGGRPVEVLGFVCTRSWGSSGHEVDFP
jgi:hypothetical protein